jgi:pantothenate kinase
MQACFDLISKNSGKRTILGIYGIPGSGKSTLAHELQKSIPSSIILPMDGFHLYKSELLGLGRKDAMERRGAPFTFDPLKLLDILERLQHGDVYAPSFDHSIGDPIQNDIHIPTTTKLIILEGLYIALKDPVWCDVREFIDVLVFIDIDIDKAMDRVVDRHLKSGVCQCLEDAVKRVEGNDRLNAEYVLSNSYEPDLVIHASDIDIDLN